MGDLISRAKLKNAIKREKVTLANGLQYIRAEAVMAKIGMAPSVDAVEVVHGRWEQCFEDWWQQLEGDKCSACGFEHYGPGISNYNYCPNCGVRMDAKEADQ